MEQSELELYKYILPQCKIVFDVGCNRDRVFYELQPELEIHLFDPHDEIRLYGLGAPDRKGRKRRHDARVHKQMVSQPNVTFNNIALGNYAGTAKFYYQYDSLVPRRGNKYRRSHATRDVPIDTLWNYCLARNISHIDLLKIDTEGYDFEVMLGAGDLIHSVDYIQFEYWPIYANNILLENILDFLAGRWVYTMNGKNVNFVAALRALQGLENHDIKLLRSG